MSALRARYDPAYSDSTCVAQGYPWDCNSQAERVPGHMLAASFGSVQPLVGGEPRPPVSRERDDLEEPGRLPLPPVAVRASARVQLLPTQPCWNGRGDTFLFPVSSRPVSA